MQDALKDTRTCLAQEEAVPAYIVFSNATLADMAMKMPRTIEQFLNVSRVGEVKAERIWGTLFAGHFRLCRARKIDVEIAEVHCCIRLFLKHGL